MALNFASGGGLLQTQVVKITHDDFATDTSTTSQTVTVLQDPTRATHNILIYGAHLYVAETWASGTITHTMGAAGDPDGLITAVVNSAGQIGNHNGLLARWTNTITTPTAGGNTGTGTSSLSLIGNTSTIDQSAALMTDLMSLRDTIDAIESKLDGATHAAATFMPYGTNIGTSGNAVNVTIGTDTAWSALTAGKTYAILLYLDLVDLD